MKAGLVVIFALLLLTGCGAPKEVAVPAGEWKLVAAPGEDLTKLVRPITLTFDSTKVNGFAGCNRYFGTFSTEGFTIKFAAIGSTKMFCEETSVLEEKFLKALEQVTHFAENDHALFLKANETVLLEFRR